MGTDNLSRTSVRKKMKEDGKFVEPVSTAEFIKTLFVAVPLWATTMLPLSLGYQIFNALRQRVNPSSELIPDSPIDSGITVEDREVIPRSKRTYDVVVMGATGFAGKLAVLHLARTYGINKEIKWAMAGRSQSKLEGIRKWLKEEHGFEGTSEIPCILVDTTVPSMLPGLVKDTRSVVATAGPFWRYGSTVVEFCAKYGTHYADITAEGSWVKTMMLKWQETAKKTGAKIVSYTGHDSIPWELSVSEMVKKMKADHGDELVEVAAYNEYQSGISGGTLATINLLVSENAPAGPTPDPFLLSASGIDQEKKCTSHIKPLPSKVVKPWDKEETFGAPFLMSLVNFDVVAWSQALRGAAPLKYSEIAVYPDFKTAFVSYFNLVLLFTGILNPVSKALFAKVLPKPGEGPEFETMENDSFLTVTCVGTGKSGRKLQSSIYFPRDAGYMDTARMTVESALAMALEETKLPMEGGGFFSPGFALGDVLLGRLQKTGTTYEIKEI